MYTRVGKDKFIKFIFYSTTRGAVTNSASGSGKKLQLNHAASNWSKANARKSNVRRLTIFPTFDSYC